MTTLCDSFIFQVSGMMCSVWVRLSFPSQAFGPQSQVGKSQVGKVFKDFNC